MIYDDDHYYLGGSMAEVLIKDGYSVVLVTPEPEVSAWTHKTMEQHRIQARLLDLGVEIVVAHAVERVISGGVVLQCAYTQRETALECDAAVLVTSRLPNEALALDLVDPRVTGTARNLPTVRAVGDAFSPGSIAAAVWDGRRFAEDLGRADRDLPFPRNVAAL